MPPPATRRHVLAAAAALPLAVAAVPGHALMAGAVPDTPAARIDANRTDSPWTSAVAVSVNGGLYSGVVVAPRHVLTAAHVVGANAPAAISVRVNADAAPVDMAASAVQRFPSASFPYDDLALITLAAEVPAAVEILPLRRSALPARQVITLVGYGWSGNGDLGPSVPGQSNVKRSGRNVVDLVQTTVDSSGRTSLFYLYDFDGRSGYGSWGGATLGNALETGLASGDSGSPAFAEIDGQRWLVGINSLVSPPPGLTANDYRFGTLCGGMLLSDPRFVDWLVAQTGGTLGPRAPESGDAPLPLWAAAALGVLLAARGRSGRRAR
jgi:secreted trypsin-like serine protease